MVRAWLRTRTARILFGLAMGAGVGVALYYARQLQGVGLFVLTGASSGGSAAQTRTRSWRRGGCSITRRARLGLASS